MKESERRILDRIYSDLAVEGTGLKHIDVMHNDDDFHYIMDKYCQAHDIEIGSLFSRTDLDEMTQRERPARLSAMLYMLSEDDKINGLRFYAPKGPFGVVNNALKKLSGLLRDTFNVQAGTIASTPETPEGAGNALLQANRISTAEFTGFNYIPGTQAYEDMRLSPEATRRLREELQEHLLGIRDILGEDNQPSAIPQFSNVGITRWSRPMPMEVAVSNNNQLVIIRPARAIRHEHDEAQLADIFKDVLANVRKEDPAARVISNGRQVLIEGNAAPLLAADALASVDRQPSAPPKPIGRRVPLPAAAGDKWKAFLLEAGRSAVVESGARSTAAGSKLNADGERLAQTLADMAAEHMHAMGIDTVESLLTHPIREQLTAHYNGMKHAFERQPPQNELTQNLVQIMVSQLIKAQTALLRQNGNSGPC